jgi:photosystem II stability/assembly factor-like uncharacterized protein
MGDTKKLIPEEMEEHNQPLLRDLRRLYSAQAEVEERLARMQHRLFYKAGKTLQVDVNTQSTWVAQGTQPTRGGPPHSRKQAWQRRLNTLAAALVAALVVGILLLVLNQVHQNRTGGPASFLKQLKGVRSIQMLDATTGWAIAGNAVLRTTDGGISWQDITPPGQAFGTASATDFLTASLAWIALPQADQATTTVFRTSDSGIHWQEATVQAPFVKHISFIDAQHGWMLSGQANAADAPAESVTVFQTTNGGQTWQSVSTALPSDTTPPGQLPYGGQKAVISFLNASTGWVTGTVTTNDLAWLYVTHDGGKTWSQQTLLRPQGLPSAQLSILAPIFFSATDGLLPVKFADLTTGKGIATALYVTHDGGTNWQPTSPVLTALATSSFPNLQQGWMSDGTSLFVTSDGGQHWARLAASPNFKDVTQLDFVSRTTGWAISGQRLLKTVDSGQTWSDLITTAS